MAPLVDAQKEIGGQIARLQSFVYRAVHRVVNFFRMRAGRVYLNEAVRGNPEWLVLNGMVAGFRTHFSTASRTALSEVDMISLNERMVHLLSRKSELFTDARLCLRCQV